MKHKKLKLSILLLLGLGLTGLQAQSSVNATGRDASGSGGSVSYSVGQVVYTSYTGSNGSVTQGLQVAYEIQTLGIKETYLNITLAAFPNPTVDNLILQISDYNKEKLSYKLFDMLGKQLSKGQIVAAKTQINMNSLPAATYFIKVVNKENKKYQSFRIIKN